MDYNMVTSLLIFKLIYLLQKSFRVNSPRFSLAMREFSSDCERFLFFFKTFSFVFQINLQISYKGAYIKYVGGGGKGFHKFFQKTFVAHQTIDLNILWPSIFFRKYFMTLPINFSFSFKTYLQQCFRVVLRVIFKFQITEKVNIHINIQKIIFK